MFSPTFQETNPDSLSHFQSSPFLSTALLVPMYAPRGQYPASRFTYSPLSHRTYEKFLESNIFYFS